VAVTSVTIATPGVFTNSGTNDFKAGDAVIFQNLGTITGISANTIYYVTATTLAATTFTVASTIGGTALQITGSTSTPTVYRVLNQTRLQTAAQTGEILTFPNPLRTAPNVALSVIASSTQTGTIFVSPFGYYGF
jgi:predicted DNA-binding transcriptional regulator AlpA